MTAPPGQDRYFIAGTPFHGKAFSEEQLRELYAERAISAETLTAPVNTTAWKKLIQAFPAWATTPPPPPLPLIPPAGPQWQHDTAAATRENTYGCASMALLLLAMVLGIISIANGRGLNLPIAALAAGCLALSYIISLLGEIVFRQEETTKKVDRLLALLEQKQTAPEPEIPRANPDK